MEQSLKRAHKTLEILEEKVSLLKDEVMTIFVHHFERARRQVASFYPNLDLSLMDLFNVVRDDE